MIKKLAFLLLFVALVFVANEIHISKMWGEEGKSFTAYEFLGPLPAAFLGPVYGAVAIVLARGASIFMGAATPSPFDIARIFTMVFAAWYFASYKKNYAMLAVPLVAMALFFMHPVGSQAWFYPLFWLVPVAAFFVRENIWLRSLGSSFVAHSVGSVAFLYSFPTTPDFWLALMPVTAVERIVFAAGVAISFYAFNTVLNKFFADSKAISIDKRYSLF